MSRKPKASSLDCDLQKDLWINPRSNIRGPDGNRAWDNQGNISPDRGTRFLELADIALGGKPAKKKSVSASSHSRGEKRIG